MAGMFSFFAQGYARAHDLRPEALRIFCFECFETVAVVRLEFNIPSNLAQNATLVTFGNAVREPLEVRSVRNCVTRQFYSFKRRKTDSGMVRMMSMMRRQNPGKYRTVAERSTARTMPAAIC